MNVPAKNEQNPPSGFRDMAITIFSQSQDSLGSMLNVTLDGMTSSS